MLVGFGYSGLFVGLAIVVFAGCCLMGVIYGKSYALLKEVNINRLLMIKAKSERKRGEAEEREKRKKERAS